MTTDWGRLPHPEDRHAGDDGVGVILGGGVDSVVGTNDQGQVNIVPVVVDLVHLVHDIVGHTSLSQKHIELTGHPASNWVDSELDVLALLPQEGDHLGNGVLALGNSETISRHNHDVPGVSDGLDGLVDLPDGGGSSDSHGLTSSSAGGSETTENDIRKGSVHGDAHNVGEDSTAGANQAADHSHQVVVQHEALSAESPSGVGVEDSDDNGHVSATNGHGESDSHHAGEGGSGAEHAKAHSELRGHEEVAHGAGVSGQKATVDGMPARQHQRVGVQVAVELAIGDEGPGEGDTTDVSSEEEGGLDHGGGGVGGKAGVVIQS